MSPCQASKQAELEADEARLALLLPAPAPHTGTAADPQTIGKQYWVRSGVGGGSGGGVGIEPHFGIEALDCGCPSGSCCFARPSGKERIRVPLIPESV